MKKIASERIKTIIDGHDDCPEPVNFIILCFAVMSIIIIFIKYYCLLLLLYTRAIDTHDIRVSILF